MCFLDRGYTTRTYEACGDSYHDEVTLTPRRVGFRRFGGPRNLYYPSSYYARRPNGPFVHCGHHHGRRHMARGVVPGGYGVPGYSNGSYGYGNGYGYGYHGGMQYGGGRYLAGGRATLPANMRSYYYANAVPSYTYAAAYPTTAIVQPATTTYTVTNQVQGSTPASYMQRPPMTTREEIQMENRRVATQRGAYSARRIKPADALPDDPFWCRERNGEYHLRTFYQIENEFQGRGQWLMDAESGFLVFHRD